jgi:ABC-type transporter Mla MlaB component
MAWFLGISLARTLKLGSGERDDDEVDRMDVAREGTMNEHENDARMPGDGEGLPVLGHGERDAKRRNADLVVDLSGIKELSLTSLALLLTAQQNAMKEDRDVWLAGVPMQIWQALNAMGLGQFFKPFPVSEAVAV